MLRSNATLRILNLVSNHVGDVGGYAIIDALATNTGLVSLDLRRVGLGPRSVGALPIVLMMNATLEHLSLMSNVLGDMVGATLAQALLRNPKSRIRSLNLENTFVGEATGSALACVIQKRGTLDSLVLHNNKGIGSVLYAPHSLTGLCTVNLDGCGLSSFDGINLGKAIGKSLHLQHVLVGGNWDLGDDGCKAIVKACHNKPGKPVLRLDIHSSGSGVRTGRCLADYLRADAALYWLNMSQNPQASWGEVLPALAFNTGLTWLSLAFCNLLPVRILDLATALQVNGTLQHLHLDSNRLRNESGGILAVALAANSTLLTLDLSENRFEDTVTLVFCAALRSNKTLLDLNLLGCTKIKLVSKAALLRSARAGCVVRVTSQDPY